MSSDSPPLSTALTWKQSLGPPATTSNYLSEHVMLFLHGCDEKTQFRWVQNYRCQRRLIVWLTIFLWQVLPSWLDAYDAAAFEGPRITCDGAMQPSPSAQVALDHLTLTWSDHEVYRVYLWPSGLCLKSCLDLSFKTSKNMLNLFAWKELKDTKQRCPCKYWRSRPAHASLACSSWEVRPIFYCGVGCWKVSLYDTLKVSERNSLHRTIGWKEIIHLLKHTEQYWTHLSLRTYSM